MESGALKDPLHIAVVSWTELIFLRVSSTYRSGISGSFTNKQRNKKQHQNSITEAFSRNNARQGQPFTQAFTQCVK